MSPDQFAKAWYENVWNKRDSHYIKENMEDTCIIRGLEDEPTGPEAFISFQQSMLKTIHDLHIEVIDSIESGNKTIGMCRLTGNHYKTGQAIEVYFAYSVVIEKDKLVESRNIVDFLPLFLQSGALKSSPLPDAVCP